MTESGGPAAVSLPVCLSAADQLVKETRGARLHKNTLLYFLKRPFQTHVSPSACGPAADGEST